MSDTLAIAAVIVAGLIAILWLRRVATYRAKPEHGLSGKAFEHVAAGRMTPEGAAAALLGADSGCDACCVELRRGRQLPDAEHECDRGGR